MASLRSRSFITQACMLFLFVFAGGSVSVTGAQQGAPQPASTQTYQVQHNLTVKDIPPGASKVRIWFWLPDDDDAQKVLDLTVKEAPAGFKLTRDAVYGHRYLYAEVHNPQSATVSVKTDFLIRRNSVSIPLDPAAAGRLTDAHRTEFADSLRKDVPNMEVTEALAKVADETCGQETNVVLAARKLYDYVVDHTNHYSKPNAPKSSGKGSADYCLANKGGACTDQHALFIALARARGIPTRIQFGSRLLPQNEGKEMDPGYRCWVQFFVPNYGWVPMDIAAGNINPGKRDFYFSGLDDRRIRFSEGRNLDLTPRQDGPPLNLFIAAYVEVDGKPHTSFARTLKFTSVAR